MSYSIVSYLLTGCFISEGNTSITPIAPLEPAAPPPSYNYNSMFDERSATNEGDDNTVYELGILFRPLINGDITGVKFWKTPNDPITSHTAKLWDADARTVIHQTSIPSAGQTGWVTKTLDNPIPILANKRYVLSVTTQYYPYQIQGLPGDTYTKDKLNAIDGVFAIANAYPNASFNDSQYYRDIVFRYAA